MMGFYFILCWTVLFLLAGVATWKRVEGQIKVYIIFTLHFFYLTGIFYLYPMIVVMKDKS